MTGAARMKRDPKPWRAKRLALTLVTLTVWTMTASEVFAATPPHDLSPSTLAKIGEVDARFQSYNIEMAEVVGAPFWKPYPKPGENPAVGGGMFAPRAPIDLANPRLRKLASALGPAYVRVSGSWANAVFFDDTNDGGDPPAKAAPAGFKGVLTRSEWRGVIDFSHAVDAQIVTSFAISTGARNAAGVWTPDQAERLLNFTRASGGRVAGAELFNEPSLASIGNAPPGYSAKTYAQDSQQFTAFMKARPDMPLTLGPGSASDDGLSAPFNMPFLKTSSLLAEEPRSPVDVFTYHFYGAPSRRCALFDKGLQTSLDAALSQSWLSRTDGAWALYSHLRDQFDPGAPIWVTETADAACGGNPWGAAFVDSFRYLDQLGRLARHGVKVVFHNTLAASDYGLIDQDTLAPRPNYWAALLWRRLMGTTVLDIGAATETPNVYAACLRGQPGGVAILALNTSRDHTATLNVLGQYERYTLAAASLLSQDVMLNGHSLAVGPDGEIPNIIGVRQRSADVRLEPLTITFLAFPDTRNPHCF